jgi:signal peptidase I
MTTLLIMVVFLGANVLLTALFLQLGARWVGAVKARFSRAMAVALVVGMMGVLFPLVTISLQERLLGPETIPGIAIQLAALIGQVLFSWLLIRGIMQTTFARAIVVWLVGLVPAIVALGLVFMVLRPHVLEAFIVPSNNMAPTVVGWHNGTVCPHCQGLRIVPSASPQEREHFPIPADRVGICTSCLKTSRIEVNDATIQTPDRIMVNKLLTPRRWDMIEFRYPDKPSVKYIMRLVGLPGETVYIREGAIWVNEVKADPPDQISALR